MGCYNRNTEEYKALLNEFESNIQTDSVIAGWQKVNNTDSFPTVAEAKQFVKNSKTAFNLKQKNFGDTLLANLRNQGLVSKYLGDFYIVKTDKNSEVFDPNVIKRNYAKIMKYLDFNNIPTSVIEAEKTKNSVRVKVNTDLFSPKDIIEKTRTWDKPKSRHVVRHLMRMFPGIEVNLVSVSEAKAYYDGLPDFQKTNVKFNQVNSYYDAINGKVMLIDGRVTDETAIEEMLHPFTDALYSNNQELFSGLLAEARKNFPELSQGIEAAYTNKRGFNQQTRDLELVTQALTRHFKKEYEETPTKSFLDKVKEFLSWFGNIINDLHKYLTGKPIPVSEINGKATLTDIAKLLNTSELRFNYQARVDGKVKFNLTPELQNVVDYAKRQSNAIQAEVINRLFHQAQSTKESVGSLAAGQSGPIIVLNEADHVYYDVLDPAVKYKSTTTRIKGQIGDLEDKQLNIDIGNDFDQILQGLSSDEKFETIFSKMKVLDKEQVEKAYAMLQENLKEVTRGGGVAIPQVVVYDQATRTAGSIDILVVMPDGKLRIVDLKTSKNSVRDMSLKEKAKLKSGKLKYDDEYALPEDSELKQAGIDALSTRAQHGLQVNIYRRMLENMGYQVDNGDMGASTFHIHVDIEGKGSDQKFKGNFRSDEWITHPVSQNSLYTDILVPKAVDTISAEEYDDATIDAFDKVVNWSKELDPTEALPEDPDPLNPHTEFEVITQALETYRIGLINKLKAMETIKSAIYMDRTKEQTEENILNSLSAISLAMEQGPKARAALYTELTRDALRQIDKFISYVKDPKNFNKPEYITYVLNFNRFLKTFEGLHSIKSMKDINETQRTLIGEFQIKLNELTIGSSDKPGLIDQAITDYVKEQVKNWSSREDLTDDMLNDILKKAKDITGGELNLMDMATSKDTLLAIMDKIYKAKKQQVLDKIETRKESINALASQLQKLSPNKNTQDLYDFMLEFDEDGNFNGRYVQRLGKLYFQRQHELRDKLYDENGNPKEYRDVSDVTEADPEDIKYNIELAKAKREYAAFWSAERVGLDDKLIDGEYHKYTDVFKAERSKYQYYVVVNGRPIWKRKASVSDRAYQMFLAKYFNEVEYIYAKKDSNGNPTGAIVRDSVFHAVKPEYRIANDYNTKTGERLVSEKYEKIMNPTDALGQVQKAFYVNFTEQYEELLKKLPIGTRNQMLGKVPVIRGNVLNDIKKKPNIVGKLFSKTTQGISNLFTTTAEQRVILTDEEGNLVDQLPIFYTGKPKVDAELKAIEDRIDALKEQNKKGLITITKYETERAILEGQKAKLVNKPTVGELNKDMGTALLRFAGMAEHYEVMSSAEDTFKAFVKVIEKREYQPSDPSITIGKFKKGVFQQVGRKTGLESNTLRRARKWMHMVFYDNEQVTRGFLEKVSDGLINYSSLAYVAFNPFGNFNNYLMGRINNSIEAIGQRFYSASSYSRAEIEFNKRALPDLMHRLSASATKIGNKSDYDPEQAASKYEAFVDLFRMMDDKGDVREASSGVEPIKESYFKRFMNFGYVLQDAAEYNVQTKVGMAMVIDTNIMNKATGEIISLYDAFTFDSKTKELKLKDGFDTIVKLDKKNVDENGKPKILKEEAYTNDFRYKLRNNIREVNKQIHGNYAKDDRMVIQSHSVGRLAAQFHKWVVPAFNARFRREYFDENLGWMEGRYRSFWRFMAYSTKKIAQADFDFKNFNKDFMEAYGYTGDGSQLDQKAKNKLQNAYRTLGEIGIMFTTMALSQIFTAMFLGDDDDSDLEKRLENAMMYQADRTYKELVLMTPFGTQELYQMFKSPIASTRTLGELGEALSLSLRTPVWYVIEGKEEFYADSDFVYQRGTRKGELKLYKNWADVVPIVYSWKKWHDYLNLTNFFIK
ncbi:MAG: hypothetical protein E6R13_00260 [Spirochaetes bacterium]|nr:MAG: hypothetical protein E6R13_00260 [Spirochaetota bacterium]